ncbi:DUF6517 family protein [Halanaeroarchaeum sulfurireducens]|uniref:Uncharacterized protein n=1 Tax=Halanaeroarchaeum sulfurireducens TaxID=1604004 RepID=A0A0F7PGL6_9EURY|nr:DUF6517 family protein [Halanaeroarchaeum sulfurireducens]AKH98443.1 hypothetical protein HLASF_1976 [Halanaeroarchaeum sulfurireducens]
MDRRDFLAFAGTGALASIAGCTSALGSVAAPDVPTDELEAGGWVLQDESEETVFEETYLITVEAKSHSLSYGDEALRAAIREKTLGHVDGTMAMFAATRIEFSPDLASLPGGVGTGQIIDRTESEARSQFESRMKSAGLGNVERVGTGTLQVDTGANARLTTYEAEFPFDGVSFPVTDDRALSLSGSPIAVAGDLAVWPHDGAVLVAGGAYPAENVEETVTEELSEAITVTVDLDLGLEPERYREEVRSLVRGVT